MPTSLVASSRPQVATAREAVAAQERWRLGRRPGLDVVRGVAILMVMISHLRHGWRSEGSIGVSIFFVLSGFLITALLLEERRETGRIDFKAFYARRARRLLPAMVVMIVVVSAVKAHLGVPWRGSMASVLLYVSNWAYIHGVRMTWVQHTWSLAIEEQFYLVWPIVLVLVLRLVRPIRLAPALAVLMLASTAVRWSLYASGAPALRVYEGTDARADALLAGCALAVLAHSGVRLPRIDVIAAGWALAAAVVVGLVASDLNHNVVGPTVGLPLGIILLLTGLAMRGEGQGSAVIAWFGRRSYGLYLWSVPIALSAPYFFPGIGLTGKVALAVASLGVAELSWRLVEKPILDRGRARR
ncbi:acyltransferase [Nocardioides sp. BP30]|uniref:acyltransferase family protein n=1 Tax=Nocardioides sp. BP30 TaxID=3036374 RepID=UPI0024684005|nr:acyltransferase [Nocardioides sp. BP30]WGL53063.1 acyltransferase [Nocardioides sp. BP30]